jgi:hypothetical protein
MNSPEAEPVTDVGEVIEVDFKAGNRISDVEAVAPSAEPSRPEVTQHDPVEFFRSKMANPERLRAEKELRRTLAQLAAREQDILGHREYAKDNRYNTVRMIDFLLAKKELVDSYYYNNYFTNLSPFSQAELTDKDLAVLESEASQVFGEGHEFAFVEGSWVYHRQPESDKDRGITVRYTRRANGVEKYDDERYSMLEPGSEEWTRLLSAIAAYHQKVSTDVYRRQPADVNGDGIVDREDNFQLAA